MSRGFPTQKLRTGKGNPTRSLNFYGYDDLHARNQKKGIGLTGILRRVSKISRGRLKKAQEYEAISTGPGEYLIYHPSVVQKWADTEEEMGLFEWLMQPYWARRRTIDFKTGESISVVDLDGWNSYWVNVGDLSMSVCHCKDMVKHGEAYGVPCKHMLKALIEEEHPVIMAKLGEQKRRDALAEAV